MRKFDFRAWNSQTKRMSYDVTLYANGWTECVYDSGMSIKHDPTELIVMQWSGLKDKKGNKIFDGDIVKVIDMPSSPHEKTYITNVIYKDGCFFLSDVGGLEIPLFETLKESYPNGYLSLIIYKVIGNIYESDDEFICPKCKTGYYISYDLCVTDDDIHYDIAYCEKCNTTVWEEDHDE